jgi:hypothetical protein
MKQIKHVGIRYIVSKTTRIRKLLLLNYKDCVKILIKDGGKNGSLNYAENKTP